MRVAKLIGIFLPHLVVLLLFLAHLEEVNAQACQCTTSVITGRYHADYEGTSWSILIETTTITNNYVTNSCCLGPILAVTHDGTNCLVSTIVSGTFINIAQISAFVPADSFAEAYSVVYTNATNVVILANPPEFIIQPESQSSFVGESARFTAFAIHTTGWHWQKDGTNLVDNGQCWGVTNSILTITNVQSSDAGVYTAVASQPGGPDVPSFAATLAIFKPLRLGLSRRPGSGYLIIASNLDGTPVESQRLSHLSLYTATNASLNLDGWDLATNALVSTNGTVEANVSDDGAVARFWRMLESP